MFWTKLLNQTIVEPKIPVSLAWPDPTAAKATRRLGPSGRLTINGGTYTHVTHLSIKLQTRHLFKASVDLRARTRINTVRLCVFTYKNDEETVFESNTSTTSSSRKLSHTHHLYIARQSEIINKRRVCKMQVGLKSV